uniref:Orn/Lys/Arg decarboxylases family 1 pyridoxal-P attachment site domain-containing protein n=1 Tax=uncultured prokaryote TaxID=198431 RepID=A0A0H5Q4G3_9ZZZZ|nr:hypothetical protein [uncultured prokaryote]
MPTPLYDALRRYADREPIRFHMPGHKGRSFPPAELKWLASIDVTELPETGNLYEAGEPFDSAQALWAELFGFEYCQFLTDGSTMGVHTGLALCCKPGDRVLIDRNCHRSAFNALALLDLEPVWLERPWLKSENLPGPIPPGDVETALEKYPDIKTVCITSPTYAGVLSDIGAVSRMIHARGGKLFVDGAHGAHLPFLGLAPFWGADCVVVSAHKTLPAMGQTALLFVNGFEPELVRRTASIFGTSSPSYPMLASLDVVRDWMVRWGAEEYRCGAQPPHCSGLRPPSEIMRLAEGISLPPFLEVTPCPPRSTTPCGDTPTGSRSAFICPAIRAGPFPPPS